jgi:hypothetical protein
MNLENEGQSASEESSNTTRKWMWEWNKCCVYWWVGRRYDGWQETQRKHIY